MVTSANFLDICRKCRAKCCRMGGPTFTKEERDKVLNNGHEDKFFETRGGFYEVKSKNGVCRYLQKDFSCEIQEAKPVLCRCWPVFPEYINGKVSYILIQCPITPYLSKQGIENSKEEAGSMPKELLEVALDFSTVPEKDTELMEKRFKRFKKKELELQTRM